MELKFERFCSSCDALSNGILVCLNCLKNSDIGLKPWTIVRRFDQISLHAHNSSLQGATELESTLHDKHTFLKVC